MGDEEHDEDGRESETDSFTPRIFSVVSTQDEGDLHCQLHVRPGRERARRQMEELRWDEAEERVAGGGDGHGDGEDVVHQQGAAGDRHRLGPPAAWWPRRSRRRRAGTPR